MTENDKATIVHFDEDGNEDSLLGPFLVAVKLKEDGVTGYMGVMIFRTFEEALYRSDSHRGPGEPIIIDLAAVENAGWTGAEGGFVDIPIEG